MNGDLQLFQGQWRSKFVSFGSRFGLMLWSALSDFIPCVLSISVGRLFLGWLVFMVSWQTIKIRHFKDFNAF